MIITVRRACRNSVEKNRGRYERTGKLDTRRNEKELDRERNVKIALSERLTPREARRKKKRREEERRGDEDK
jgi:hypothetical protein